MIRRTIRTSTERAASFVRNVIRTAGPAKKAFAGATCGAVTWKSGSGIGGGASTAQDHADRVEIVPRYAGFLRGVNLGPTRKTSSADLKAALTNLGFDNAATFRTSGNVIFDSPRKPSAKSLDKGFSDAFGFEIRVLLRSSADMKRMAAYEPFDAKAVEGSKGKLQVMLLEKKLPAPTAKKVLAFATDADRLTIDAAEVYWLPSGGTLDSDLDLKEMAKLFGGLTTMRTKGTVDLIHQKFFA